MVLRAAAHPCHRCRIHHPEICVFLPRQRKRQRSAEQILRELQDLGVGFGTYGPSIKPQNLKNQMLRRIPELQWLTVTQNGMCAEVVVRERRSANRCSTERRRRTSSPAARASSPRCSGFDGATASVSPGQAVESGQLLVSAYTDLEFKTQVSAARRKYTQRPSVIRKRVLPGNGAAKAPFRDAAAALAPAGEPAHLPLGRRKFRVKLR